MYLGRAEPRITAGTVLAEERRSLSLRRVVPMTGTGPIARSLDPNGEPPERTVPLVVGREESQGVLSAELLGQIIEGQIQLFDRLFVHIRSPRARRSDRSKDLASRLGGQS